MQFLQQDHGTFNLGGRKSAQNDFQHNLEAAHCSCMHLKGSWNLVSKHMSDDFSFAPNLQVVWCRQIASQASLIMLAGYETTAVVLSQCVYMLSKHPQAQQKLLQEVDGSKKQISYEDLWQFPFASAVLKEVLRLVGPLAFFSRINTKDTQVRLARQRCIIWASTPTTLM